MGDFGIKITKEGKDVSSTDPNDYILRTKQKTLSIKKRGTTTVSTTVGEYGEPIGGTVTVAHSFGYVPQFVAYTTPYVSQLLDKFVFSLLDYVNLDFGIQVSASGGRINENVSAYTTDTSIVFTADLSLSYPIGTPEGLAYTYTIDYILFMEEAIPL
jgi:hypothetical protein